MAEEFDASVSLHAHPASAQQWHLSPEAVQQLVKDLPGTPVRFNYQGDPIGEIVEVKEVTEQAVTVSIRTANDQLRRMLEAPHVKFGPMMINPTAQANSIGGGEHIFGTDWVCQAVGAVNDRPPREETMESIIDAAL